MQQDRTHQGIAGTGPHDFHWFEIMHATVRHFKQFVARHTDRGGGGCHIRTNSMGFRTLHNGLRKESGRKQNNATMQQPR